MLTEQEKQRLEELTALKKKSKLNDKEFKEFRDLKGRAKEKQGVAGSSNKRSTRTPQPKFDPGNDPSWWMKQPELIRDCASFKSNYVAGRVIDPIRVPYVVPGVLSIVLRTCYFSGSEPTDVVNVWARNLYLKMFQKYRPANNYSASDLGIAIFAGLEAVKLIAMYERIYGVINRYSVLNVNMPAVEATALGLSASQLAYLQGHLSDFRYDLNYLIRKAQRLCIPKDISLIADSISLLGYEYIDHANPRGQIIIFNLDNLGTYSDTAMSTGGSIQYIDGLLNSLFDFNADNMCIALNTVLNALLGSDSIQRIYADLVVWFGDAAMLQFLPVPEDYTVIPVESESILHKLHNLEFGPDAVTASGFPSGNSTLTSWARDGLTTADESVVLNGEYHVYQYNDAIVTTGVVKDTNAGTPTVVLVNGISGKLLAGTTAIYSMGTAHVFDGYNIEVTPEFIIEGSLFKYVALPSADHLSAIITSNVAWLVKAVKLYSNSGAVLSLPTWRYNQNNTNAADLALVDWAPLCYHVSASGNDMNIDHIAGDIDVIIPVSAGDLTRIHRTCFISGITTEVPVIK